MRSLELYFLGGFDVRLRGEPVTGFESRKVRALLAYLVLNAGQPPQPRDRLAELLWPDEDPESGRRKLRQALYNLKLNLGGGATGAESPWLRINRQTVAFDEASDYFLDVEAFESALASRLPGAGSAADLTQAIQLYRGELLAGSLPNESQELEQWALLAQERLRELALHALDELIEIHASRAEHAHAILYAKRLLDLDPLAEHAHRALMRLYAASGRRSRALAQYETCLNLLRLELGVEPLAETTVLYQAILQEEIVAQGMAEEARPHCPTIPLMGRRDHYAQLRRSWNAADGGAARIALVMGESGSGKTRLAKAFVHDVGSRAQTRVIFGRCFDRSLPRLFEPFRDAVTSLLASSETSAAWLEGLPVRTIAALLEIAPGLRRLDGLAPRPPEGRPRPPTLEEMTSALDLLFDRAAAGGDRLVLLIDDLQCSDEGSLELLAGLLSRSRSEQLWVVATCDLHDLAAGHPVRAFLTRNDIAPRIDRVPLSRLEQGDIRDIARAVLTGAAAADDLAALLGPLSGGLPLAFAEWINCFCQEGALLPSGDRWEWRGTADDSPRQDEDPESFEDLVRRRVAVLPESTRRLLFLASVIGQRFEADVLAAAADEHPTVVDLALEILLERWVVRHFPAYWYESRRERDIVLWSQGARRGSFEFAHRRIRRIVYESANPFRRRLMHARVAAALEDLAGSRPEVTAGTVTEHLLAAESWAEALPRVADSAERAVELGLWSAATAYLDQAARCLDHLGDASPPALSTRLAELRRQAPPVEREA